MRLLISLAFCLSSITNITGQISIDTLIGKYEHITSVRAWNGCCSKKIILDLKKDNKFSCLKIDDEGCYMTCLESAGIYFIKQDTISLLSPLNLVDSLSVFYEAELPDSLFKVTVKPGNRRRSATKLLEYFEFYTVNDKLQKKKINNITNFRTSNDTLTSISNNSMKTIEEISFYFDKNQVSDYLYIRENLIGADDVIGSNCSHYPPKTSWTFRIKDLKGMANYFDIRDKNAIIKQREYWKFTDMSRYQLIFDGQKLISTLDHFILGKRGEIILGKQVFTKLEE